MRRNALFALFASGLSLAFCAHAQQYPSKPVTIVMPLAPGGGTDFVARPVAEKLRERLGQAFVLDHRQGAGGNIAAEYTFKAAPDGYTLLLVTPAQAVINKYLFKDLRYNPDQFAPISVITASPNVLVVNPKVPAKNVRELIALAKASPGKLSFGSSGAGATTHLAGELFKSLTQANMVHVPYKGAAAYLADVIAGRLELSFFAIGTALPHIKSGKVRALGVGGEKRNPLLPDIPPIAEDIPGFLSTVWYGMVAPPKTPSAITEKISSEIAQALKSQAVSDLFRKQGVEAVGSTPAQMALFLKQENQRWGKLVTETAAKAN